MFKIEKTVRIGTAKTYGGRYYSIFCRIELIEGKLSITGVEGPLESGNCLGACGQIDMHLKASDIVNYAPDWNTAKLNKFLAIWKEWHLNDMCAGSPNQREYLEAHPIENHRAVNNYFMAASGDLTDAGLNPDENYLHNGAPYKYGTAWLSKDLPLGVVSFLTALPETDKTPAWV